MLFITFICILLLAACVHTTVSPKNTSTIVPSTPSNVPTELPTKDSLINTPPPIKIPPEFPIFPTQIYIPTGGYEPQPSDSKLSRGNANLEFSNFRLLESQPVQVTLELQGYLPNGCHQLRVAARTPDAENRIYVEVYSVYGSEMMCTDVIKPFEITIPLGSFPIGHYTLWINGKMIGEFVS